MKTKQKQIAKMLGYSETYISLIFKGRKRVSWLFAERVNKVFPGKDVPYWKKQKGPALKKQILKRAQR